ncbi:prepilin-type N-terminal cleavage/methylation domain-containing protein [Paenibacillus abyssi]|uniref:Prepilin-type N-terminal cleavage/methylation domain-containing protein n=1 Tax=Paenibacillus abyssi TaxID=1340531 RepID=A0A917G5E5_9BACL|nr:prepilin-type N-terminal cleavage/methylation domain-containing protein [Paenibacillus abyssi]GGG23498.1 hypothetical protein GCM10010916_45090 [Paenibacillus abyssi]
MYNNERGVSLAEVLGALSITAIVLGVVLVMLNQTHTSSSQITSRETIKQESRDIIDHMVRSIRTGFTASVSAAETLRLEGPEGQYISYRLDGNTLESVSFLIPDGGTEKVLIRRVMSSHVDYLHAGLSESNTRVEITLRMQLPNGQIDTASTVAYTLR